MTTCTYRYAIANSAGASHDATAEEIAACTLPEWQAADDLPDGTEFARGVDADGKQITAWRISE